MPTGYTADVQSGQITDFPAFALLCAREFGATITMRDDPLNAEIPDEFQPSRHRAEWAASERERLAVLVAMTGDQIAEARDAAEAKRAAVLAKTKAKEEASRARYEAMLVAVREWEPPTIDHIELKTFMIKQITESIKFDCGPTTYGLEPLPPAAEWHAQEISQCAANLARYELGQREEDERTAQRNAWVKALRQSLADMQKDTAP